MTGQHAHMLAEQDSRGARSAEVRRQHRKNQSRECKAWKQRTYSNRSFDGQARWQQGFKGKKAGSKVNH